MLPLVLVRSARHLVLALAGTKSAKLAEVFSAHARPSAAAAYFASAVVHPAEDSWGDNAYAAGGEGRDRSNLSCRLRGGRSRTGFFIPCTQTPFSPAMKT